MKDSFILALYKKTQTVFTLKELAFLFPQTSYPALKNKVNYCLKTGKLISLRRGVYAKEKYNFLEVANRIYTPSYISLETVLAQEGVIFQKDRTVFAVSYLTRKIKVGEQEIFYRKIKDEVLLNNSGINKKDHYFLATKERAFLDAVFLYGNYHFDNLENLNWSKLRKLAKIYTNKALGKRLASYYQDSLKENV